MTADERRRVDRGFTLLAISCCDILASLCCGRVVYLLSGNVLASILAALGIGGIVTAISLIALLAVRTLIEGIRHTPSS